MNKLFIIGNGFDLAHKLKTSYENFHKYLLKNYCYKEGLITVPESTMLPKGDEEYNDNEVITILIDLISEVEGNGENWSDIETSLGLLDFNVYLESYDDVYCEEDDDGDDFFKRAYMYEDISSNLHNCAIKIKDFFSEWVNTIEINNCKKKDKLVDLINKDEDIFLTFNYTTVLEDIYDVKNVFHIHGVQDRNIVIGHGKDEIKHKSKYIGSEYNVEEIHENLRKNTDEIIKSHKFFKIDLSNINEIYSYGFSFSEVDMIYIKEICKKLKTSNIIWYLSNYESEEIKKKYENRIKSCGFKGDFAEFNI